MCGIAGFVDPFGTHQTLERMTAAIARRGPDDFGYYLKGGIGLGHRRLSIIELSSLGHQPMRFHHLVLVFNGEIYNYKEVARELEEFGYQFQSSSDSEVLVKAFHRWGPRCVDRLIGMFAFAVYDERERALYVVRDRAGVKPLYFYHNGDRFAFASQLNALKPFLSPAERDRIDPAALSEFLALGYVSGGRSILMDVKKVPQAHYLRMCDGKAELHRYWDVSFQPNPHWSHRREDDLLDELDELVVSACRYRMVADVPVGVFLSAGVDSSLVGAVLSKHYGGLRTFTIGFDEPGYDESGDARRIADHLGSLHTEARLGPDKGMEILDVFYDIFDEPHGDSSAIATTFVSELAKAHGVKVVLSADAGDELFGGYGRYPEFYQRWSQLQRLGKAGRALGRGLLKVGAALSGAERAERFGRVADLLVEQPFIHFMQRRIRCAGQDDYRAIFPQFQDGLTGRANDNELLDQMCEWDFKRYMVDDILVKVDRATMYHSIEGREPLLDHRLVEFAAQLPSQWKLRNGETKYILKKLLARYLPEPLFRLPKRGFSAPLSQWIERHYRDRFVQVLQDGNDLFDRKQLGDMLDRYRQGKPVNYTLLWYLFSFQCWHNYWREPDIQPGPVKSS